MVDADSPFHAQVPLGDTHNFGRRVVRQGGRILKPRTVFWEQMLLDAESPLRTRLDSAASSAGMAGAFSFLPDLKFAPSADPASASEVEALELAPLGSLSSEQQSELAEIVGRSLALWSWLGVSDLHWENLALGKNDAGRIIFAPLDIEAIFDDFSLPTATKLLPDADPEIAEMCQHACGVRRVLPFLGKPIRPGDLVAMAAAYLRTLDLLDENAESIAVAISGLPNLGETPIRVCLRGTDVYVLSRLEPERAVWPPFLDAELEQMERGDIPYFFRLIDRPGIFYFGDATLETLHQLPTEGDVPQLEPLLDLTAALDSPNRDSLRVEGLFTVLAAFDDSSFSGRYRALELEVEFGDGILAVEVADEFLETDRDLSDFVSTVYLPDSSGEVETVFAPQNSHGKF